MGDAHQPPSALARRHPGPRAFLKGATGRHDGPLHILLISHRHGSHSFTRSRVCDGGGSSGSGAGLSPIDHELIELLRDCHRLTPFADPAPVTPDIRTIPPLVVLSLCSQNIHGEAGRPSDPDP